MRTLSAEEAAALVRPDDTLGMPLGPGQPPDFLHALGKRDDFTSLDVFAALLVDLFPLFAKPGVRLRSGFYGPVERALAAAGHRIAFVPGDFRGFERIARTFHPRVVATSAAPPDASGRLSLSLHAGATVDELHRAARDPERLLVVEVNPGFPRTSGLPPEHPHQLALDEVDVLIEGGRPPRELPEDEPTEAERAIARHVRAFVRDGSTLQTGIGGIPSAVAELLAEGDGGDYGVHSEMFTTGLMRLQRAGKVVNRKGVFDGFSVCTFALGTADLHAWLHENDSVRFLPVGVVNDASVIGRNRRFVSLNGALGIDLAGQIMADTVNGRQYSGIGGHEDFVAGAAGAAGGRSLVCLPATAGSGERRVSRIVTALPRGAIVTTPRHHVDVVVTEYGAAELSGRSVPERAEALIAIAHPAAREALRKGEEPPEIPAEDGA